VPKYQLQGSGASQLLSWETHANSHKNQGNNPSPVYHSCWASAGHRQFQPALKQMKTTHCMPELQPGTGAKILRKSGSPWGRDTKGEMRGGNGER